jgi:cell division protein FtsB
VGLVVSVVLVGFLLVGVFPTRAWLAQRQELQARQSELDALEEEQQAIEDDVAQLQTPEEIERIARQEYGMVREDETAFRMLPAAEQPVDLPDTWPFIGTEDWLNR